MGQRRINRWLTRHRSQVFSAVLAAAAFALYVRTAARTITWANQGADGAELSAAASVLGVAHPTGYPVYILVAHLFTLLPVGEVAFRVGLLSALAAAVGVGLASQLAGALGTDASSQVSAVNRAVGAAAAGAALATAPLYWSQATIPEVYAVHAALVLGTLTLLAAWRPGRDRLVVALALIVGLGLAHHAIFALLAAPAGVFVAATDRGLVRRAVGLRALGAFALGIAAYAYLPLRAAADPALNWGDPRDLSGFVAHVTGRPYWGYLAAWSPEEALARVPAAASLLFAQLTAPGLVLGLIGLDEIRRRRPGLGRLLLVYVLLSLGFALAYRAAGPQVHMLPIILVLAVGLGTGIVHLAEALRPRGRWASWTVGVGCAGLTLALVAWQLRTHGPAMDLSADRAAQQFAAHALADLPTGGVLVTERDEETFALWYTQIVEGLRPDVAVIDRRLLGFDWYRGQIERRYPGALERMTP